MSTKTSTETLNGYLIVTQQEKIIYPIFNTHKWIRLVPNGEKYNFNITEKGELVLTITKVKSTKILVISTITADVKNEVKCRIKEIKNLKKEICLKVSSKHFNKDEIIDITNFNGLLIENHTSKLEELDAKMEKYPIKYTTETTREIIILPTNTEVTYKQFTLYWSSVCFEKKPVKNIFEEETTVDETTIKIQCIKLEDFIHENKVPF